MTDLLVRPQPVTQDRPGDRAVTALIPPPAGALGPVSAARMRRALAVYAAVWVLGVLPAVLGASAALQALGLGIVAPGGGLWAQGSPILGLVATLAFVSSLSIWWAAGPVVLPPIVLALTAGLAAWRADDAAPGTGAVIAVALAVPALALLARLVVEVRHRRQLARRRVANDRLAHERFTVTGPPTVEAHLPVVEHSEDDLAHLRYSLDLALQPLDRFDGFTHIDQFREAALRYQLTALSNSLAMAQLTRTPAFGGYLAEGQRNAIEKMLDRRVWGYWAIENAWGNLSLNRDPLDTHENIMLSGWHGIMVGAYATLNDDRYSRPGALTFRWSQDEAYAYDFGGLADQIRRNVDASPYALFACEPNWIYPVCNSFGMNTLLSHDRLHGTDHFAATEPRLRAAYESDFLRPDGRMVGVRSAHLGLSWNFWTGAALQLGTSFWLNPTLPEIAHRTWWLLRENTLTLRDGVLHTPRAVSDRLDPGNYKLGSETFGHVATTLAARELGDEDVARAAETALAAGTPTADHHGARRYDGASPLANCYANLARFGRRSGLRDLIAHGVPETWTTGPRLAEAAYPEVQVARAVTDGHALDLVLRPGAGPVRTTLRLEQLVPGRQYTVRGGLVDELIAAADGSALLEVELDGRREVRIA
ncbi:hypothetical protein [Paraconexibacter algicola]|uniref:Linalool dehydratase/isomerase domain-containing protein n=1 Tax=Paraconexibacter algicola TaxID=2133960 RepID=A0A2T4UI03_9ACTN|nr:hypothetical protein [Paraconexibacter algicola]PTL58874.1 hypothetical protein C7Y72_04010 [Paraconexibacter algicola]